MSEHTITEDQLNRLSDNLAMMYDENDIAELKKLAWGCENILNEIDNNE